MDTILSIPFLGEFITGTIASFVAVKVRQILHRTTIVVNTRGKKSFNALPSWVKALAYQALLDAKAVFPDHRIEDMLEYACNTIKCSIKGKLDDIVIDVIKEELKTYIRTLNGPV